MSSGTLLQLARRLHEATTLAEVMDRVADAVDEATRYRRAWLTMPMEHGTGMDIVGYVLADRQRVNQRMASLDWRKDRLLSLTMNSEGTLVIPDMRLCPEADPAQVEFFGNRTVIAVPMLRLGERLGCLNIGTFAAEGVMPPTAEEIGFAEEVAALVSVVAGRIRAEAAHRALEASVQREQRLEALGRMAGEVAHDFNNVLVTVIGNAELALGRLGDEPLLRELLSEVLSAGSRAATLARQLLAFSRGQPVERREVDLRQTMNALTPMLRALLPSSIQLEVVEKGLPREVLANAGQLEQLVMNLVLNARDAIDGPGRITLTLDSSYRAGRRWSVVEVRDSGAGMPPEVLARVFEPFFTTKEAGQGTGLGLAVVDAVVKSHGGTIEVASRPGEGTCFTVSLPESDGTGPRPRPALRATPESGRAEHLLVVDDDTRVRVLLERVLTTAGYRVTLAEDGVVALQRLAQHPDIRLVITDLAMPRMGGDELLRRLAGRVRALLVSGYAAHAVSVDRAAYVLPKPFSSTELLVRVREVLDAPAEQRAGQGAEAPV
ncbi:MAG: response regulator [Deltaproteobacteria bacterium]|nr:response regulator [Deltaproteobacteria bacterium]